MLRRAWPLWSSCLALAACGGDDGTVTGTATGLRTTTVPAAPGAAIPQPERGETLGAKVLSPVAMRDEPGGRVIGRVGVETEFDSDVVLAVMRVRGRWLGVLSNIADMRTVHSSEAYEFLKEHVGEKMPRTRARSSIAYAESAERAVSILDHRPDRGAAYAALPEELLDRLGLRDASARVAALV